MPPHFQQRAAVFARYLLFPLILGVLGLSCSQEAPPAQALPPAAARASREGKPSLLAPAAPVVLTPANGSVINDPTPTFSGTAAAGTTVTVLVDGTTVGTTPADGSGAWSFTLTTPLADGVYAVKATATDGTGTSPESNTNNFAVDTTPPAAPVVLTPSNGSTINNDTPTYSGTAEAASTATVFVDGAVLGTTVANASGNWTFTQVTLLANGVHTVKATAMDSAGNTSIASNTNTFTVATNLPVANNDSLTVAEDSAATVVNVLANDTVVVGTLTITSITQPSGGTTSLSGGILRFTPAPNFSGITSFTYTVTDGNGGTATASVTVTVTPVNDPPTANNDSFTVIPNSGATVLDVMANDTSAPDSGETLTVTSVTQPPNGTTTLTGGLVRFTPAANFTGTTSFTYTISDGNGGTATATVAVTVMQGGSGPTAVNDSFTVPEDSPSTMLNVLANDSAASGTLTLTSATQPANGNATLSGGALFFTPAANFTGTTSLTYTISDGTGQFASATVTVTVMQVNDPPTAGNDSFTVTKNSGATVLDVLSNDNSAPDQGETLTVVAVSQPANGTATLTAGVVRFTPAPNFVGTTVFTYTVSDGNGGSTTATVVVTVTRTTDGPTANPDTFTVADDSEATVLNVLANDAALTGTLTVTQVSPSASGTVTLTNGVVRFTPAPNFLGTTSFTYTITDGTGKTDSATVTVSVILECTD